MPYEKVTRVLSRDSFRIANDIVRLEGVGAPEQAPSGSRLAKEQLQLESLILGKAVRYEVKTRDEFGQAIAQVWLSNVNVNRAMKEYIKNQQKYIR